MIDDVSDDDCPILISAKVPVTILTGFLGSGKTTLIHYILSNNEHNLKIAVIVNEFEFGKSIEKGLTIQSSEKPDEEWIEMTNGCICCSAKPKIVDTLESLIKETKYSLDLILIETSGMADPSQICSLFWVDDALTPLVYLSGVVTIIDSKNIYDNLKSDLYEETYKQILIADNIIFNKLDLINEEDKNILIYNISKINPILNPIFTTFSKINFSLKDLLFINTTQDCSIFYKKTFINSEINIKELHLIDKTTKLSNSHSICTLSIEISLNENNIYLKMSGYSDENIQSNCIISSYDYIDLFMNSILSYHEDSINEMDIVRMKAAVWVNNTNSKDTPNLYQIQCIGATYDISLMAGISLPLNCNRFLILGRKLNIKLIRIEIINLFSK